MKKVCGNEGPLSPPPTCVNFHTEQRGIPQAPNTIAQIYKEVGFKLFWPAPFKLECKLRSNPVAYRYVVPLGGTLRNEVASLLRPESRLRVDETPIYALMEMGVGPAYAADFARVLRNKFDTEVIKAAAFALAKLGAKEYKQDIAKLLGHEFRKGDAATVLALMGATEYMDQIASLLKDRDGRTRTDALLALGIMRATKYVPQVAKHLKDPEGYVPMYAAYALVLLEADRYAERILPKVEHLYRANLFLGEGRFHPFAEDEIKKIKNRFKESLLRMKATRERQKAAGEFRDGILILCL